jgi:hypothetical protein
MPYLWRKKRTVFDPQPGSETASQGRLFSHYLWVLTAIFQPRNAETSFALGCGFKKRTVFGPHPGGEIASRQRLFSRHLSILTVIFQPRNAETSFALDCGFQKRTVFGPHFQSGETQASGGVSSRTLPKNGRELYLSLILCGIWEVRLQIRRMIQIRYRQT